MTITNTIGAKLTVAFVAIAMLFTLAAPASAATAEELEAQIATLMATIAALQAQVGGDTTGGGSGSSGVCPYDWTRDLTMGSTGNDVLLLQQYLNADPETRVAATGVGSAGQETQYYGALTGAAVAKYQTKYRASILTPLGLVNATTYFGPSTRSHMNSMCTSAPAMDDDDANDDDDDDANDDEAELEGDEATLDEFEMRDGDDTDVTEGQENAPIADLEITFEDGDVAINRLDLFFDNDAGSNNDEMDPWDTFETVSLWVDGEMVAEENADDEDDWSSTYENGTDPGTMRFSGLDIVAREDDQVVITVAVSVQNGVDINASGNDWRLGTGSNNDNVLRGTDALGLDINEGTNDTVDFTIEEAGADDDLDLRTSDEDPDPTTLALDEDNNTEHAIFVFELDADDSDNDVEINDITVNVWVSSSTLNTLVRDFRIEIDGDSYDAESYTGSGTGAAVLFDVDGDTVIDAGESVNVTVYAEFEDMDVLGNQGSQIQASTTPLLIDAEGAEDIGVDGPAEVEGELHTLRVEGVDVVFEDSDAEVDDNLESTLLDDEIDFTLEFEVTAFGETIYIPFGAGTTTDLTNGFQYSILDSNGNVVVAAGTSTASSFSGPSSAREDDSYKVSDGQSVTFTLSASYNPANSDEYRIRLDRVNFATSDVDTATVSQDVSGQDIETVTESI